jgi:hypothetical protein
MDDADRDAQRDRQIAQNESERQTAGDIRVSSWALAVALILVLIGFGLGWLWVRH